MSFRACNSLVHVGKRLEALCGPKHMPKDCFWGTSLPSYSLVFNKTVQSDSRFSLVIMMTTDRALTDITVVSVHMDFIGFKNYPPIVTAPPPTMAANL